MKFFVAVMMVLFIAMPAMADDDIWYVKAPIWMGDDLPQEIDCVQTSRMSGTAFTNGLWIKYDCRIEGHDKRLNSDHFLQTQAPEVMTDGHKRWVNRVTTQESAICDGGVCETRQDDALIGYAEGKAFITTRLNKGYYLVYDNDQMTAYKFGTGPYASTFQAYYVESSGSNEDPRGKNYGSPSAVDSLSGKIPEAEDIEHFWCNPQGSDCSWDYNGKSFEHKRNELPKYLPMADVSTESNDVWYCPLQECRLKSDESFIGLNPFYYDNK